jgi:hypothetical protein
MRKLGCLIALSLLPSAANARDLDIKEDPFAYEEREAERERERERDGDQEEPAKEVKKESFGNSGDFVLSVERLVGYSRTAHAYKQNNHNNKVHTDHVQGFLSSGGDPIGYSAPRIAFDFFVTKGLSLGGSVGYAQDTSSEGKLRLFSASPRIGYALMFGKVAGIWPRLGATYELIYTDPYNAWLLAGTFELPLVLVAGSHAAFTLGPRVDYSFTGQMAPENGKVVKLSAQEFGFSAGVSLFF